MPLGPIFSEETQDELRRMQSLIQAVQYALPLHASAESNHDSPRNDQPLYDKESATLHISTDPQEVIGALRVLGEEMMRVLSDVRSSMETWFVDYFNHLKSRHEEELALWMPGAHGVTKDDAPSSKLSATALPRSKPPNAHTALSVDSLTCWLNLELEAVMTATGAARGGVYLKSQDGTGYLRPALLVPSDTADLPHDTALASGSTLGTVVLTGIGVNITQSHHSQLESGKQKPSALRSAPSLKLKNGLCFPLPLGYDNFTGCVVLGDKRNGAEFTEVDEHRLWAFTSSAEAIFQRYAPSTFLQYKTSTDVVSALKAFAKLPPASDRPHEVPIRAEDITMPLRDPKLLLIRRGTGKETLLAKREDDAAKESLPYLDDEDVIETVAPFVQNIKSLWRNSLVEETTLRNKCDSWEQVVASRNNKIVDLEVLVKSLNKQLHKMRMDIQQLKQAAPAHLSLTLGDQSSQRLSSPNQLTSNAHNEPSTALVPVSQPSCLPLVTNRSTGGSGVAASGRSPRPPNAKNNRVDPKTAR